MSDLFPSPSAIEAATDALRAKRDATLDYLAIAGARLNDSTAILLSLSAANLEEYLNACGPEMVGKQMELHYTTGSAINAACGRDVVDISPFADKLAARGLAFSFDHRGFTVTELPPTLVAEEQVP